MDSTQQLHLGIGRIFQGNQLGGKMMGYSTLQTHAFHFFTHDITSSTLGTAMGAFEAGLYLRTSSEPPFGPSSRPRAVELLVDRSCGSEAEIPLQSSYSGTGSFKHPV
jgi:hypothetical protein